MIVSRDLEEIVSHLEAITVEVEGKDTVRIYGE
jgi:hypothetical protein